MSVSGDGVEVMEEGDAAVAAAAALVAQKEAATVLAISARGGGKKGGGLPALQEEKERAAAAVEAERVKQSKDPPAGGSNPDDMVIGDDGLPTDQGIRDDAARKNAAAGFSGDDDPLVNALTEKVGSARIGGRLDIHPGFWSSNQMRRHKAVVRRAMLGPLGLLSLPEEVRKGEEALQQWYASKAGVASPTVETVVGASSSSNVGTAGGGGGFGFPSRKRGWQTTGNTPTTAGKRYKESKGSTSTANPFMAYMVCGEPITPMTPPQLMKVKTAMNTEIIHMGSRKRDNEPDIRPSIISVTEWAGALRVVTADAYSFDWVGRYAQRSNHWQGCRLRMVDEDLLPRQHVVVGTFGPPHYADKAFLESLRDHNPTVTGITDWHRIDRKVNKDNRCYWSWRLGPEEFASLKKANFFIYYGCHRYTLRAIEANPQARELRGE